MKLICQVVLIISIISLLSGDMPSTILSLYQISIFMGIAGIGLYGIGCIISIPTKKAFWLWLLQFLFIWLSASCTIGFVNQKNNDNAELRLKNDDELSCLFEKKTTKKDDIKYLQRRIDELNDDYKYYSTPGSTYLLNQAKSSRLEKEQKLDELKIKNLEAIKIDSCIFARTEYLKSVGSKLDEGIAEGMAFASLYWNDAGRAYSFFTICLAGFMVSAFTSISFTLLPIAFPNIREIELINKLELTACKTSKKPKRLKQRWNVVKQIVTSYKRNNRQEGVGECRKVSEVSESVGKLSGNNLESVGKCRNVCIETTRKCRKSTRLEKISKYVLNKYDGDVNNITNLTQFVQKELVSINIVMKRSTIYEYLPEIQRNITLLKKSGNLKNE